MILEKLEIMEQYTTQIVGQSLLISPRYFLRYQSNCPIPVSSHPPGCLPAKGSYGPRSAHLEEGWSFQNLWATHWHTHYHHAQTAVNFQWPTEGRERGSESCFLKTLKPIMGKDLQLMGFTIHTLKPTSQPLRLSPPFQDLNCCTVQQCRLLNSLD